MFTAFYFANSVRYGRHFREVRDMVNGYMDWENDNAISRRVPLGKKLYVCLSIGWNGATAESAIAAAIASLRKVWRRVKVIELADEPKWNPAVINANAAKVRAAIKAAGLEQKPLTITFHSGQILKGENWKAKGLDAIGIETYIDYRAGEGPLVAQRRCIDHIDAQLRRVGADKKIVLVGQAYDRNGTWKNLETLVAIQAPIFHVARREQATGRLLALTLFSYARPGGTRDYPALKTEIKRQLAGAA